MVVRSPVLGYNTNVRHAGKLYHIQTEDSGLKHPHIITHLFADGGRIVASIKSSYAEHLAKDDVQEIVKRLMREQHKGMFIALRDGKYDETQDAGHAAAHAAAPEDAGATIPDDRPLGERTKDSKSMQRPAAPPAGLFGGGNYREPRPAGRRASAAAVPAAPKVATKRESPALTLDEVILSYLAEDLAQQPNA